MANWLAPFTGRSAARSVAIDAERDRLNAEAAARSRHLDEAAAAIRARTDELDQILNDITQHRRGRND